MDPLATNQAAASAFVIQLSKLGAQWYGQIERVIGDVDGEPYASLRASVSKLRELASGEARTRMGAFILTSNAMIGDANLPRAVDILAQAVVSAFLVRNLERGERALRLLYQPFKDFIPLAPVTPSAG